ncbi:hypothetical protein BDP27DRAFT_1310360 [Rhodocollybia butyracea]|uniref:Uncharacterized protein n=1 Tax=Rhodocollybia butyracea TaxID=206335 RepID=A0A9P5QA24_9AGAR|nr:hypothetical protein BDP27DRAFT_1310360 [Rhodocollybia butyracea]
MSNLTPICLFLSNCEPTEPYFWNIQPYRHQISTRTLIPSPIVMGLHPIQRKG